jgi:carboxyl-terminal processing protease
MTDRMKFKQIFLFTSLSAVVVITTFLAGYFTHARQTQPEELPILNQAYEILLEHGLNVPTEGPVLEYGMIRGMLEAFGDPHSSFAEPAQAELTSNLLQGSFGGIGVTLGKDAEGFPVLLPIPDGPADKSGIQEGDRLVKVNDLEINPDTAADTIMAAIRGPVGENVKITIARAPDYEPQTYTVKRQEISLPSVTWYLEPSEPRLGMIKINVIAATTPDEIQKAVQDLRERGATAFALDLRDNYGGLLDSGVEIARLFLKDGIVIEQQYRNKPIEQYKVTKPGMLSDLPIVTLVNQNTASAAEIIAGALQAQHRAKLIGVPTYGKNTIQLVFQLLDGSSMNVTSAHWWVPGLDTPRPGKGILPDITIPDPNASPDPFIQAAIREQFPK